VPAFFSLFGPRIFGLPGPMNGAVVDFVAPPPRPRNTPMLFDWFNTDMPSARKSPSARKKAKRPRSPVQAYLASLPANVRKRVNEMRAAIRAAAPRAIEGKSYAMLGYKLDGRPLVYCAGFKRHTSLFPMTASIRRAHAAELEGYKTSTGTIQFPLNRPLPKGFVKRLVKARLAEMRAKSKQ
jgi:uncharacterized protein YdhG (YjbR/CyaY superfamily)